jgi:acyl-coenzyme A thioesterase PaaI-like protein
MAGCYGCVRLNPHGLQIKSYWEGEESVCRFRPQHYHAAFPGYVYGGLIASLIDCHATGKAGSAKYLATGKLLGTEPLERFVTASLHVDYQAPTSIDAVLELRGRITEIKGRKMVVSAELSADGRIRVHGEAVTLQIPADFFSKDK